MPHPPRRALGPILGVGLSAAILAVVGCTKGTPSGTSTTVAASTTPAPAVDDAPVKLLAEWPTPAGAILFSGEQNGYIEPCGCSDDQLGGLRRRLILAEQLRRQGFPLVPLDLGGLINDPNGPHGGPEESKIRYTIALKGLDLLKYEAFALSAQDLKLGVEEVLGQYLNLGDRLKVLSANVTPKPESGLGGQVVPLLRIKAGTVKLGITATLDPASLEALKDPNKSLLEVKSAEEVLPGVLADLERDTDLQILLVQGPTEVAERLAKKFPGFDVVVATSTATDAPAQPKPLNDGKTLLVQVGRKGQYVGVLGIFPEGNGPRLRYQRVTLGKRYDRADLVALGEPMKELIDVEFPGILKSAEVLKNYTKRRHIAFDAPMGSTYVGVETCKQCHPGTVSRWSQTKHAAAYAGLTKPGRNREWDAECVRCHTTGFEYLGGYIAPDDPKSSLLKGNQCENCHGPGSSHAAEPDNKLVTKTVARSAADWDKNHRCIECHDEDNSPHFDFGKYWSQVVHSKLDDYKDPKTHVGVLAPAR